MRARLRVALIGLFCWLGWTSQAAAWNDFGHMEVAAVAFKRLNARTRHRVAELLRLNPRYPNWILGARRGDEQRVAFLRAATWADAIRSDAAYRKDDPSAPNVSQNLGYADTLRHDTWHFVDQPFSPDGTALVPARTPNVATQIRLLRQALVAADTSDEIRSYDLVWLLHLVGDVHQPLHCVSRFDVEEPAGDRGGNNVKIAGNTQPTICEDPRFCPFGPPNQLHGFYDEITGASYGIGAVEAAAAALPRANSEKAAVLDESVWIEEGFALAKGAVYIAPIGIGDGPFTVDTAYQAAAYKLGKQQIALAGARLANLLNATLGK